MSREGGGNNYYGADIKDVLLPIKSSKQREGYILMDFIVPKLMDNYLLTATTSVKQKNFKPDKLSGELGIFGVILADDHNIFHNFEAGSLLRSKLNTINEGGIMHGSGALDTVFLYD